MTWCRQCENPIEKGIHTCGRDSVNTEMECLRARVQELEYHFQTLLHAYKTGNSISTIREAEMRKVAGLVGRGR